MVKGFGREVIGFPEIWRRFGQVFVCLIAGSNGLERVAVLPIGLVRKAAFHYSRFRIFGMFFFQICSSEK